MSKVRHGLLILVAIGVSPALLYGITTDWARTLSGLGDVGVGVAIRPDGRILVAGRTTNLTQGVKLARLLSNGGIDPTFGSDGLVDFFPPFNFYVESLVLQSDGLILVGGLDYSGIGRMVVLRFLADGTLDTTFGAAGIAAVDFAPAGVSGGPIALAPDGKIVIVGSVSSGGSTDFAAARFNSDGTLDTTFGSGGRVVMDLGGGSLSAEVAQSAAILSDGRIVLGGRTDAPIGYSLAVARLLPTGSPDTSFGTGGKVVMLVGESSECRSLALQRDGKVVAVGPTFPQGPTLVVRFLPNGALDPTFGQGGTAILASVTPNAVALDAGGGIDIAGDSGSFAFTRLLSNGTLDPGVGPLGFIELFGQTQGHSHANAIAVQPDGRAVVAGDYGPIGASIAVARFAAETSTIPTLSSAGLVALGLGLAAVGWLVMRNNGASRA